ncbi:PREDICTED: beta-mannosidase [Ceratosolen solmsi marchali]|uniref:beta-mannosidase n=1 Tax=Ceratosolen solmsi marchali TaxID=326594 RepID=A0AAJ7DWE3_9HYME|nr:PREDICTED: beta-mannosidase [Ceratosolen solmsi marchali]
MHGIKIFLVCLILCFYNVISISLNGKWRGYIPSTGTRFIAEIPGGIYSDLERCGIIKKNLLGFNDVINRWVANETIVYTTNIQGNCLNKILFKYIINVVDFFYLFIAVNNTFLSASHIILIFHGLDTFTKIYVNDFQIGETSNMFLKYSFDIKSYLKSGDNELKVIFESSVKIAEKLYNLQSLNYIVPPKCVPSAYNGECHVNHIRKMQASYGWDWGPAFPSMGIWYNEFEWLSMKKNYNFTIVIFRRNVEVEAVDDVLVSEVTVDIFKQSSWKIVVTAFVDHFHDKRTEVDKPIHIICMLEDKHLNDSVFTNLKVINNRANASVMLNVPLDKVETWWPNGYGKQSLYSLNVRIKVAARIIERKFKIGFRTIELIQEPLKKGLSFYFKVNGIPVFAKGSNWIPSSIFPEHLENKEKLENLLKAVKDTHANMLRVWGGGVYESDLFYSLADEYGIMIWQDFMFACNMYPTTKFFLDNVKEEVIQNTRRLKYHPSIALWAGNNENEAALYGNWYGTGNNKLYKDDYVKLYVDTIKNEAIMIDSTRPFAVSSPSNGLYSEEKNYTESNPYSNLYGDVHYYNYVKNSWDINQYPITRFASEYGFQALPSVWTMISASKNLTDLQLNSSFMTHRQHLPQGNVIMRRLIDTNFIIPNSNNTIRALMDYTYLSQVTQAVSMRIQTELYRQTKSSFNDLGEGLTMGALYWQLNDVWQAPSWSSVDIEGRWKMLHYYAKEFFSPLIVTSKLTQANELLIFIVSDLLKPLNDLAVEMNFYEWKSSTIIHTNQINNITLEANESKFVIQYWIDKLLESAGCGTLSTAKENCFLELILKDVNNKIIAPRNYVYPHPMKKISLPNDSITIDIQFKGDSKLDFQIEIVSQNMALFVWLEIGNVGGYFSENGFHVLQGKKSINFHAFKATTIAHINKNLIVTSLSRIYNSDLRALDAQIVIDQLNIDG